MEPFEAKCHKFLEPHRNQPVCLVLSIFETKQSTGNSSECSRECGPSSCEKSQANNDTPSTALLCTRELVLSSPGVSRDKDRDRDEVNRICRRVLVHRSMWIQEDLFCRHEKSTGICKLTGSLKFSIFDIYRSCVPYEKKQHTCKYYRK